LVGSGEDVGVCEDVEEDDVVLVFWEDDGAGEEEDVV
jgi:hypothetical protein